MNDEITIGARLRALRRWRGMNQAELAGLAGLSQPFLSRVEHGLRALDRRSHITALAAVLQVSETEIVGGPHLSADPVQADPHNSIPALQAALGTNTLWYPTVDRARPLPELVAELAQIIGPKWRAGDFVAVGEHLPGVLDELHVHTADPADEAAHRLALETLIDACYYACWCAYDLGYRDLAQFAANRGVEAAVILDDPVQRAKAEFPRVITMPRVGNWDRPLIAAEHAANALQPHVKQPLDIQVLGEITLTAAFTAAVARKGDVAKAWMGEAQALAQRVPDDPVHNWSLFSATNVGIWRVEVGVELGETGGAVLELAEGVKEDKLATIPGRKANFLAEIGRGLARDKATRNEAVRWLREAENVAPQLIRNEKNVRHTCEVLHEQALAGSISRELRGMMARMGIPH